MNETFDMIFNKQYEAIKLLFENGAKIDAQMQQEHIFFEKTSGHAWQTILMSVQSKNISINSKSIIKQQIYKSLTHLS